MAIYAQDASGKRVKVAGGGGPGGGGTAGVSSFNGRTGEVTPQVGDYTAEMVGAVPAGQGGVGRSMAGETVTLPDGTSVTARVGAETFNDYRARKNNSGSLIEGNIASGQYSHAEGSGTTASGAGAHSEGYGTIASGGITHAEGYETKASGDSSHAEGNSTEATGHRSHAEGSGTAAIGNQSHAEGSGTVASGGAAHAEGRSTVASGYAAHAEGEDTIAQGEFSHASGYGTIAHCMEFVIGKDNVDSGASNDHDLPYDTTKTVFIVGNGITTAKHNCFRVSGVGAYGVGAWNSSGADYAELFEWLDGNLEHEDRAGLFVTLEGEHIRIAGPEDGYILGVVSASPSVVGDVYDDQWSGMHIRDVFGRIVNEMQDFPARTVERPGPDGQMETVELTPAHSEMAPKINPDYDNTVKYQPRTQRPEWDAVGLLGKLVVVDDGSCRPDGWAIVGQGGKATASMERTKYRVMARLDDSHIRLMIL